MTEESSDTKTCPFCAETIKAAAVVCKHCGRDLIEQNRPPVPMEAAPAKRSTNWMTIALIVLVAIPALVVGSIYIRNKAIGPQGWLKDDTEKLLRARMRDPESMLIREHFFVRSKKTDELGMISLCGVVDGKNSYGALTGGTRFVAYAFTSAETYTGPTEVYMEDRQQASDARSLKRLSAFESVYWNGHCVDEAHPELQP